MSSIRNLKKDIMFLTSELITECYIRQFAKNDINKHKLAELMVESIKFEQEFLNSTNHYRGKNNKQVAKSYFKKLRHDMYEKYIDILNKIEKL